MRMTKTIGLSLVLLVASAAAMAGEIRPSHHHPVSSIKSKPAHSATRLAKIHRKRRRASDHLAGHLAGRVEHRHAARRMAKGRLAARHIARRRLARHIAGHHPATHRIARRRVWHRAAAALPPPDRYIGAVQVIGRREIGKAAWYGGRHVGERTASGERLDRVHVTAAHRWLPLYSLVRVTNLRNGHSVIATINDRGPVSHRLLIDLSPKAARDLDMIRSGIATVAVEPVAVEWRPLTARRPR